MTIAAGFVCNDGIVLAADSEISTQTSKWEGRKLFEHIRQNYGVVVTGAGDADLLNMAAYEIGRALAATDKLDGIRAKVSAVLDQICERCIDRYQDGDPNRPQLFLLIAARMNSGQCLLLRTNENRISSVDGCEFVGIGADIARAEASWLYQPDLTTAVMSKIALQLIYWVKQHVLGCGQATYVISLREARGRSIELCEDGFFWGLHDLLRPILLSCMDIKVPDEALDHALRLFEGKIRAVRRASVQAAAPFSFPIEPDRRS